MEDSDKSLNKFKDMPELKTHGSLLTKSGVTSEEIFPESSNHQIISFSTPKNSHIETTLITPTVSYSFDTDGRRVKEFTYSKDQINAQIYSINEYNQGVGLSTPTSDNTEAFIMGYKNILSDTTISGGIKYEPLKANIGGMEAKLGVAVGASYSESRSYAELNPKRSIGNLTLLSGISASVEHVPSGFGINSFIVPPAPGKLHDTDFPGIIGISATYRFR